METQNRSKLLFYAIPSGNALFLELLWLPMKE